MNLPKHTCLNSDGHGLTPHTHTIPHDPVLTNNGYFPTKLTEDTFLFYPKHIPSSLQVSKSHTHTIPDLLPVAIKLKCSLNANEHISSLK
jgi:hypothetical protein